MLRERIRLPKPLMFALAGVAPRSPFTLEPFRQTLSFGQINIYLGLLVLVDLLVLGRRGSKWTGVGIGLATAIKLTPGIFIIYLLVVGRWRAAITAIGTVVGVNLLSALIAPTETWRYFTSLMWETSRVGFLDTTTNQSINGLLARLDAPFAPGRLPWLLLAALVAGVRFLAGPPGRLAGDELAGLTIAGLVGVLVSPVSWVHHIVWVFPAMVILTMRLVVLDPCARRRRQRLRILRPRRCMARIAQVVGYSRADDHRSGDLVHADRVADQRAGRRLRRRRRPAGLRRQRSAALDGVVLFVLPIEQDGEDQGRRRGRPRSGTAGRAAVADQLVERLPCRSAAPRSRRRTVHREHLAACRTTPGNAGQHRTPAATPAPKAVSAAVRSGEQGTEQGAPSATWVSPALNLQDERGESHGQVAAEVHRAVDDDRAGRRGRRRVLQDRLNALNDLALTLKHIHWNVVGPALHRRARDARPAGGGRPGVWPTRLAERIATLGVAPVGTPGALVKARTWDDYSIGRADAIAHLGALDLVYQGVIADHREAAEADRGDRPVSNDLLIGHLHELELYHWFVRAHLESSSGSLSTNGAAKESTAAAKAEAAAN